MKKTVLLATDFSQSTGRARAFALTLCQALDAALILVHGIEPIAGSGEDEDFHDFFEELRQKSEREMENLLVAAKEANLEASTHIEVGERWRIILEQAEKRDVDLVILGRRMYREGEEFSLGTTSQRVFFASNRPVMIVPREEDDL